MYASGTRLCPSSASTGMSPGARSSSPVPPGTWVSYGGATSVNDAIGPVPHAPAAARAIVAPMQ
ncbi:MAG TPA: hypothetical protein VNA20_12560 [Frankiaceae bacterium]|nr:hypothetical protein [Frankiaceae bacterium]